MKKIVGVFSVLVLGALLFVWAAQSIRGDIRRATS